MFGEVMMVVCCVTWAACSMAPTHLMVTRAGPCTDSPTGPITVSELSLSRRGYNSLFSGNFNISKNIANGWKVMGTMQKCVDIRDMESCDFFQSFTLVKSGCGVDADKNHDVYRSILFSYVHPKLQCPVQAGHYKLSNFPVITSDNYLTVHESKISTSVFGYTFRLDGFTKKRQKIFCVEAVVQLLYMRKHNWVSQNRTRERATTSSPRTHASEESDE